MATARNSLRTSRYKILRSAGFSAKEAAKLRARKPSVIEAAINDRQAAIKRIPVRRRSKLEKAQLQSIKTHKADAVESRTSISSRPQRLEMFSEWSSMGYGFPEDVLKYIQKINRAAGKRKHNSYGYRIFYHEFVFGRSRKTALEIIEKRDT